MTALQSPLPPTALEPTWYRIALAEVGVQEIEGLSDNPRIQEYGSATTLGAHQHDEVPWCSAFANWCMMRAGMKGTGSPSARSWLTWGQSIASPKLGAITVFSSPARGAVFGHVAFYVSETPTHIRVLGGNQNNRVCAMLYDRKRLLGYRWPRMDSIPPAPKK